MKVSVGLASEYAVWVWMCMWVCICLAVCLQKMNTLTVIVLLGVRHVVCNSRVPCPQDPQIPYAYTGML